MKRSRVVIGAIGLLCIPAGLVLLFVGLLRATPPSPRPTADLGGTTTALPTSATDGTWSLDPGRASSVTVGTEETRATLRLVEGGLLVDGDKVVGGVLKFSNGATAGTFVLTVPSGLDDGERPVEGDLTVGDRSSHAVLVLDVLTTGDADRLEVQASGAAEGDVLAALGADPPGDPASEVTVTLDAHFRRV